MLAFQAVALGNFTYRKDNKNIIEELNHEHFLSVIHCFAFRNLSKEFLRKYSE